MTEWVKDLQVDLEDRGVQEDQQNHQYPVINWDDDMVAKLEVSVKLKMQFSIVEKGPFLFIPVENFIN